MMSDIEMVSSAEKSAPSPPTSRSPSPAHDTPSPVDIPHDVALKPDPEPRPNGMSVESLLNGDAKAAPDPPKSKKSSPTSSSTAAGAKVAPNGVGAKPKSTKSAAPPRSPSPSPPPPVVRPPLQTIRLDIPLGGPEDYEVDISSLSKYTGQRPPTPPLLAKPDTSDESHSEGDDEGDGPKDKKKKRKKKNLAQEYYDTTDPFIDDSELAQDERKFFAQTKQKGFYVSSGQVALMNKTPTKKPKSRKVNIMAPSATVTSALSAITLPPSLSTDSISIAGPSETPQKQVNPEEGTRESPIALVSDGEDDSQRGLKRKTSLTESIVNNLNGSDQDGGLKKRRKTVEIHPFSPELERDLEQLRDAVSKENFEHKGKFPQNLKPLLAQVALKAIILGEYDDNFFNLMPRLFPYNKFTMTKLIKRTVWRDHTALLTKRQNQLIDELKKLADEGFPKAKEEYERSLMMWEKRQERLKAGVDPDTGVAPGEHSVEGTPVVSDGQATPKPTESALLHRSSVDENAMDTGLDHDDHDQPGGGGRSRDVHPPAKRYRLTDKMKEIIWQLVCLSNECCRIENEKNTLEGNNHVVSDQGVRKTLYQKIVAAFPDGWLSSGQISRDVSVMKKKYEKDSMDVEA